MTWKTRQLRQVQRVKGASASRVQTRAMRRRFGTLENLSGAFLSRRIRTAGASARATSAPSGRSRAEYVIATVNNRALGQLGWSWNRAADQRARAMQKSDRVSVSGSASYTAVNGQSAASQSVAW